MSQQQHSLEVIDRDGWHRIYPLKKPIVYIGSELDNDIVLETERGEGVAKLHAQLIAAPSDSVTYQLINLTNDNVSLDPEGKKLLPPQTAMNMVDQTTFMLGEYNLVFHAAGGTIASSAVSSGLNIGLSLEMTNTQLAPDKWLDGVVVVRNLGEDAGVQFDLDLDGFEPAYYELEPGPLLSSGAENGVFLRLFHRNYKPIAGEYRITIRATAPTAYGGEVAAVSQVIEVLPFYQHKIRLLSPGEVDEPPEELKAIFAEADHRQFSRPDTKSGLSRQSASLWSSDEPPRKKERKAVAVKARPPRQTTPPESESDEESADWFATPVQPSTPPPAIPTTQTPLQAVPFADAGEVQAEAADWWGEPDDAPAGDQPAAETPPESAEPAKPAAKPESPDEAADWWDEPAKDMDSTPAESPTEVSTAAGQFSETEPAPLEPPPIPDTVPAKSPPQPSRSSAEVKDVTRTWLERADQESARARQLSDEVSQSLRRTAAADSSRSEAKPSVADDEADIWDTAAAPPEKAAAETGPAPEATSFQPGEVEATFAAEQDTAPQPDAAEKAVVLAETEETVVAAPAQPPDWPDTEDEADLWADVAPDSIEPPGPETESQPSLAGLVAADVPEEAAAPAPAAADTWEEADIEKSAAETMVAAQPRYETGPSQFAEIATEDGAASEPGESISTVDHHPEPLPAQAEPETTLSKSDVPVVEFEPATALIEQPEAELSAAAPEIVEPGTMESEAESAAVKPEAEPAGVATDVETVTTEPEVEPVPAASKPAVVEALPPTLPVEPEAVWQAEAGAPATASRPPAKQPASEADVPAEAPAAKSDQPEARSEATSRVVSLEELKSTVLTAGTRAAQEAFREDEESTTESEPDDDESQKDARLRRKRSDQKEENWWQSELERYQRWRERSRD